MSEILAVPFTVSNLEMEKITSETETAIVLLLVWQKRGRSLHPEGRDKILFVSKLWYPLWAVPWSEGALMLDGLDVYSARFEYGKFTDVDAFIEDLELGFSVRKEFKILLDKYRELFSKSADIAKVEIRGLIFEGELLKAISETVKETGLAENSHSNVFLAPQKLNMEEAVKSAEELMQVYMQVARELSGFRHAKKMLEEAMNYHTKMVLKEIDVLNAECEDKLNELQPEVKEKVSALEKEQAEELEETKSASEKQLKELEKERARREQILQRHELKMVELTARKDKLHIKGEKRVASVIQRQIKTVEKMIGEEKKRLGKIEKKIQEIDKEKERETAKIQRKYAELIALEEKNLTAIKTQYREKIEARNEELKQLKLKTELLISRIDTLIAAMQKSKTKLEEMRIPLQPKEVCLVGLPFYLVGYSSDGKTLFETYSPLRVSIQKSAGAIIKRTLFRRSSPFKGGFNVEARSKTVNKMINFTLKKKIEADKSFAQELLQNAHSNNALADNAFRKKINEGLETLKAQEWIDENKADELFNHLFGGA